MKKNIITIALISAIIIAIGIFIYMNNKDVKLANNDAETEEKKETKIDSDKTESKNEKEEEDENTIVVNSESDHVAIKAKDVDAVAICTVNSIDGVDNQNPKTKGYDFIYTYGTLNVKNVLYGDLDKNKIEFMKGGGKIKYSKYQKGLSEAERTKFGENLKLTEEEMENKYVKTHSIDSVNELDKDKTYLCYLTYRDDYGKYTITSFKENLREVSGEVKSKNDKITVKNPETGKFETFKNFKELDENLYKVNKD